MGERVRESERGRGGFKTYIDPIPREYRPEPKLKLSFNFAVNTTITQYIGTVSFGMLL